SQSQDSRKDGKSTRATTSVLPTRSTATISCAPQSANHSRPSCHRGDSPKAIPVNRRCSVESLALITTSFTFEAGVSSPSSLGGGRAGRSWRRRRWCRRRSRPRQLALAHVGEGG